MYLISFAMRKQKKDKSETNENSYRLGTGGKGQDVSQTSLNIPFHTVFPSEACKYSMNLKIKISINSKDKEESHLKIEYKQQKSTKINIIFITQAQKKLIKVTFEHSAE